VKRVPPLLTLALVGIWLLLAGEVSVGQSLLGLFLAVLLMLAAAKLRPVHPRLRRLYLFVPLVVAWVVDMVRSNVHVARIVLGLVRDRQVRSGFLHMPLELTDPHALAILAVIVTSTPGTSWAGMSADGSSLSLHMLDLHDESEWTRLFKQRYEQRLRRIFE
jgi:multicomponent K+:H+ antiporter subunit E